MVDPSTRYLVTYVVLAALALVGAVRAFPRWLVRRRLRAWAKACGWSYVARDDSWTTISRDPPFGRGPGVHADDVVHGLFQGVPVTSFDLRTTVWFGYARYTFHRHVVVLRLPVPLPVVQVRPEGLGSAVDTLRGEEDVETESDEFNRTFRVSCEDPSTASAVLHPRLIERLLRPDAHDVAWRTDGHWLVSWRPGGIDVEAMAGRMGLLTAILASVPRHVWHDHGYDPPLLTPRSGAAGPPPPTIGAVPPPDTTTGYPGDP